MLGLSDDHVELHTTARRFLADRCPPAVPRRYLDGTGPARPAFWDELASLGWLGLHLPEDLGGSGYGLAEAAVVLEELGRACAPGPLLPTVVASAVIDALGSDDQRARWLPGLADGSHTAALALDDTGIALGGDDAVVLVRRGSDGCWSIVEQPKLEAAASVDLTRPVAAATGDGQPLGSAPSPDADAAALGLLGAECTGGAAWCVDTAAAYAAQREQFGRVIGQFQGVKHRCADMLVALEEARATAWDAVRPGEGDERSLAAAIAASTAPDVFLRCAKDCIQVLGGIGFTWEHDAHLYLKRAMALVALVGGSRRWAPEVFRLGRSGVRRSLAVDLPPEAEPIRARVREELAELAQHPKPQWRGRLADAGLIAPHWPSPWGRDADAVEQLVIDEEMRAARVRRPHLQVGAWVLPTLIAHGTPEQQDRFIPPTLRGEITWCQLFSEPGAGSDLAGLTTKGVRTGGGWLLTGQKVWTTFAHMSDWGLCLARTTPLDQAPKHEGITCFLVDMRSEGLDIRPLRELTGEEMFNEVFLTDVFVPDELVVGAPGQGWRAGRTTLANERVSMGSGSSFGFGVEMLLGMVDEDDGAAVVEAGRLLAEAHALAVMGLRMTARAVNGAEPGPESSVRKLLGVEHEQRVQETGLGLLGSAAARRDATAEPWVAGFLANRCLTIAGGTSEVQRNVIGERLLGLPKDP